MVNAYLDYFAAQSTNNCELTIFVGLESVNYTKSVFGAKKNF